jgi:hypothetical protein
VGSQKQIGTSLRTIRGFGHSFSLSRRKPEFSWCSLVPDYYCVIKRRAPQKGQQAICRKRKRVTRMRRLAIDAGLCRSERTRPAGLVVRREFGDW